MKDDSTFTFENINSPEKMLIELCFYFSVLIEYQLNDLQSNVREFVLDMSNAIQEMDKLVEVEGRSAQEVYESLFNQTKDEASNFNNRADKRAQEIFLETLNNLHPGQTPLEVFNSDPSSPKKESTSSSSSQEMVEEDMSAQKNQATDKIWSDIAKKFESFCRLEERLRPQVYTMIQALNFEDIQTQRIDHALNAQKKLNEGIVKFLKKGLNNCSVNEIKEFSENLIKETKDSYTMMDERKVFDQVFINNAKKN